MNRDEIVRLIGRAVMGVEYENSHAMFEHDSGVAVMDALDQAGLQIVGGWQGIESAPKDGTRFYAAWRDVEMNTWFISSDIEWHRDHWCSRDEGCVEPTHWIPFIVPPETAQ